MSPAKSLPMQAMMLWMAGNTVQIFSISIVVMLLYQPIKAILSIQTAFIPFRQSEEENVTLRSSKSSIGGDDALIPAKLTFFAFQLLLFSMGLWKCQGMGLLPTSESDWLSFYPPLEYEQLVARPL